MNYDRPDHAREIRASLTNAVKLCHALQLNKHSWPQSGGLMICCPSHGERTPSCLVNVVDGTILVKCFGCGWAGDALSLIAVVRGLSLKANFPAVLLEAAEIAGLMDIAHELRTGETIQNRPPPPTPPAPSAPKPYPPRDSVDELWKRATPVTEDRLTSGYLVRRRLDPELVAERNLARVISEPLPQWARYRGQSWLETGHRMVCRSFDCHGQLRSVRATRVSDGESPKRLPPSGHRMTDLVLVNAGAWKMLRGRTTSQVVIVEGEPDFLTHATVQGADAAVIGIVSGSWSPSFAQKLTPGCDVVVRVHTDAAGEKYAQQIIESIGERCRAWRAA